MAAGVLSLLRLPGSIADLSWQGEVFRSKYCWVLQAKIPPPPTHTYFSPMIISSQSLVWCKLMKWLICNVGGHLGSHLHHYDEGPLFYSLDCLLGCYHFLPHIMQGTRSWKNKFWSRDFKYHICSIQAGTLNERPVLVNEIGGLIDLCPDTSSLPLAKQCQHCKTLLP